MNAKIPTCWCERPLVAGDPSPTQPHDETCAATRRRERLAALVTALSTSPPLTIIPAETLRGVRCLPGWSITREHGVYVVEGASKTAWHGSNERVVEMLRTSWLPLALQELAR